jgi:hypothetical protein
MPCWMLDDDLVEKKESSLPIPLVVAFNQKPDDDEMMTRHASCWDGSQKKVSHRKVAWLARPSPLSNETIM